MKLQDYNSKRNFSHTPEPVPRLSSEIKIEHTKNMKALEFVIQKHFASHLHYDFRLELDGVLKSFALPKGPTLNPDDKRLAIMVEDHPFAYKDFEGTIPEGNYGAGEVIVWDNGTYLAQGTNNPAESEKEIRNGLKEGKITFVLDGKKMKGAFTLIKLVQSDQWLLLKQTDSFATKEDVRNLKESVISGIIIDDNEADSILNPKKTISKKTTKRSQKSNKTLKKL